jgi:heme d1 biosynthesis radical SAM protein NirJ
MFRLSQFMRGLVDGFPAARHGKPSGPVVIWNLIRRCNLTCRHCYSLSADKDYPGELSFAEISAVMKDMRAFGVPALILSGGEPLLRPDLFEIAALARELGFYVGLSSNGTLIDAGLAQRIFATGFNYVGISLDGIGEVHDTFRGRKGAFDESVAGLRHCHDAGVKVGLRFTMTEANAAQLPLMLELMDREAIDRFYLSHLNYAGRGRRNRGDDAFVATTRRAMDLLFETSLADVRAGRDREWVTGNNDADGAYFHLWALARFPERAEALQARLREWGGNASGVTIANVDNLGEVHPDTMWWHYSLGNVRKRPFSDIWQDISDPIVAGLRQRPRPVGGRCASCRFLDICNGNTRVRALRVSGDVWAEDPGCYLDDAEIGMPSEPEGSGEEAA